MISETDKPLSLSVIIPLLNEEENVVPVTQEIGTALESAAIPYEIICVSNGSTDRTEELVYDLTRRDSRIKGIYLKEQGYGLAVATGFKAATMDLLTIMSGDGQVDPRDLIKAYEAMKRTDVDIVKPRRIERGDGRHRMVIAGIQAAILKILFRLPGWDINGTPKIIKREFAKQLNLKSHMYFIDPEIMIKAKHLGGSMIEIPVGWKARERGTPHVAHALFKTSWHVLKNIVRWRIHYKELVVNGTQK